MGSQHDPRINADGPHDPLYQDDPWMGDLGEPITPPDRRPTPRRPFIGAGTHPAPGITEAQPRRGIHDLPPEWDGADPHKNLEPYLKLLKGWLITTSTHPSQRGLIIMQYTRGDLRQLIDTLDLEELTREDSGDKTYEYIKREYSEYMVSKKPLRLEESVLRSR
jgi:hypothetical protein